MKEAEVLLRAGDIVNYKGSLGIVIIAEHEEKLKGKPLFLPAGYGSYWEKDIEVIDPAKVFNTSLEEKIEYLKQEFVWGEILRVIQINAGEYIIFEYSTKDNKVLCHNYLNFKDTNKSYNSLDKALIGIIDYKYQGANSQATILIERMLEINKEAKE